MKKPLHEVYDTFAHTYEASRGHFDISDLLDNFYARLPLANRALLDLGCGAGEPVAQYFLDRDWSVVGVDFSEKMIELAGRYAPAMQALQSDITEVDFYANQFEAITATYSLFHIGSNQHATLFKKMYEWLLPGGKVLFTYATREYTGSEAFDGYKIFLGQELYYSHKPPSDLYADLKHIGFYIDVAEYKSIGDEVFLWVTMSKPEG